MTELQNGLILLIKSGLTGEAYKLPEDLDLTEVFRVAIEHGVDVIAYHGAIHCGADANRPEMREQRIRVFRTVSACDLQTEKIRLVLDAFEEHKIEHMPLKGTLLRSLYPEAAMRKMSDADVMIREEQYDTIRGIMKELGFTEKYESDHELAWSIHGLHIELHKRLIPSYNKDYYSYYGDGWNLARPVEGSACRYCMEPQDELIYLFTHFAKHYRDEGIGLRHVIDFWVYHRSHPELDAGYIREELKKLQLLEFYDNVMNTLAAWFDGGAEDDKTAFITQVIFAFGRHGHAHNANLSGALKGLKKGQTVQDVKRERMFRMLFPRYIVMSRKYRVLKKAPVLLPVMWVVRIFDQMTETAKIRHFFHEKMKVQADEVSAYQESLNFVGLDFNFSE